MMPIAAKAKRTGRNNAKTSAREALWAVSGRSDGGGKPVMTADLSGSGVSEPQLGVMPLGGFRPQRRNRYILMLESTFVRNDTTVGAGFSAF